MPTDFNELIPDLKAWSEHNGRVIDAETWVANEGNFRLAIAYSTIFWPGFVRHNEYVLREGFSPEALEGFERRRGDDRRAIEAVMNHVHLDGIQHGGCEDISRERLVYLGDLLKEIHEVKLKWQFPDLTFAVEFYKGEALSEYELTFWQQG